MRTTRVQGSVFSVRGPRSIRLTLGLGLASLLALGAARAGAAGIEERAFLWQQANAAMGTARTPEDFAAAAALYGDLVAAGARNGAVFHNEGTARLLAGRPGEAVRSLLRAERYAGARPETAHNLELAVAAGESAGASLPWYRVPLFWHYAMPCPVRATVASAAFSALWLAAAVRLLGRRTLARTLAAWAGIALLVFGTSVAATLYAEARAGRERELARMVERTLAPPAAQPVGRAP